MAVAWATHCSYRMQNKAIQEQKASGRKVLQLQTPCRSLGLIALAILFTAIVAITTFSLGMHALVGKGKLSTGAAISLTVGGITYAGLDIAGTNYIMKKNIQSKKK